MRVTGCSYPTGNTFCHSQASLVPISIFIIPTSTIHLISHLYSDDALCASIGTSFLKMSGPETSGSLGLNGIPFTRGAPARKLSTIHYLLSTIYYLKSTIYYLQSTIYYLLSTTYYLQSTIYYLQSTIYYLLSTIYYLQSTIYYLQSTIYYLKSTI